MPNQASSAARNRATHNTANHATRDIATSTSHATDLDPSTTEQVDFSTTHTLTRNGDRTDQGKNQEQSTNRAGITMLVVAARRRRPVLQTLIRVRVLAAAGVSYGA